MPVGLETTPTIDTPPNLQAQYRPPHPFALLRIDAESVKLLNFISCNVIVDVQIATQSSILPYDVVLISRSFLRVSPALPSSSPRSATPARRGQLARKTARMQPTYVRQAHTAQLLTKMALPAPHARKEHGPRTGNYGNVSETNKCVRLKFPRTASDLLLKER